MIGWHGWTALGSVLLVWGFAPRIVLHLLTFAWPKSDERRHELRNSLEHIEWAKRPLYVLDVAASVFTDALPSRAARRHTLQVHLGRTPVRLMMQLSQKLRPSHLVYHRGGWYEDRPEGFHPVVTARHHLFCLLSAVSLIAGSKVLRLTPNPYISKYMRWRYLPRVTRFFAKRLGEEQNEFVAKWFLVSESNSSSCVGVE